MNPPDSYYFAAEALADCDAVTTATVTESADHAAPVVEVVIEPTEETVPPAVYHALGAYQLGIADVTPQGTHLTLTAFA